MSEIRATTISDETGNGPIALTKQSAAKAWLNWLHSTNTYADSNNISSGTDLGTGNFRHAFTSNMSNGSYVRNFSLDDNISQLWTQAATASQFDARTFTGSVYQDKNQLISVHGDLA